MDKCAYGKAVQMYLALFFLLQLSLTQPSIFEPLMIKRLDIISSLWWSFRAVYKVIDISILGQYEDTCI